MTDIERFICLLSGDVRYMHNPGQGSFNPISHISLNQAVELYYWGGVYQVWYGSKDRRGQEIRKCTELNSIPAAIRMVLELSNNKIRKELL